MGDGLCPPIPFAGTDITGNPTNSSIWMVTVTWTCYTATRTSNNKTVTKIYFNVDDGHGGRKVD